MLLRWIMICPSCRLVHSLEELAVSVDLVCLTLATGTKTTLDVLGEDSRFRNASLLTTLHL
jgi:hypothetical protein